MSLPALVPSPGKNQTHVGVPMEVHFGPGEQKAIPASWAQKNVSEDRKPRPSALEQYYPQILAGATLDDKQKVAEHTAWLKAEAERTKPVYNPRKEG